MLELISQDADFSEKNTNNATRISARATNIRHGSAAWRGILETGAGATPFRLIFAEPIF
jgi:hypothetical protein